MLLLVFFVRILRLNPLDSIEFAFHKFSLYISFYEQVINRKFSLIHCVSRLFCELSLIFWAIASRVGLLYFILQRRHWLVLPFQEFRFLMFYPISDFHSRTLTNTYKAKFEASKYINFFKAGKDILHCSRYSDIQY